MQRKNFLVKEKELLPEEYSFTLESEDTETEMLYNTHVF